MFKANNKREQYKLVINISLNNKNIFFISFKFRMQLSPTSQFSKFGKHQEKRVGGGNSSIKKNFKMRSPLLLVVWVANLTESLADH